MGERMTTKPRTRKAPAKARKPRCITEKEAAAFNFEAWQGELNTKMLPNNEEFTEDGLEHLITCSLAVSFMHKTKSEMVEMFKDPNNEKACCALLDRTIAAHKFFSHFLQILELINCRFVCAGSSVLQGEKLGRKSHA
jgi:hypothetical protein